MMSAGTPAIQVENTHALGAEVILKGSSFEECAELTFKIAHERGLTFIHPFDDPLVIAGQGTIGLEMLKAVSELDTLVVPIGGGGDATWSGDSCSSP